ncbi:MAG: hypothetical protein LUD72_10190 [Bacteroidales bacterium]|nr:hypothetical protein [Bacteroidales bacterium]
MKRTVFFFLSVALVCMCGDPILMEDGERRDYVIAHPIDSVGVGIPGKEPDGPKTLYVTGVEYPEGVDWQGDIGYDISGSTLFLMKDGEKIVELPVGYDNCVAIDADMHRCIDGRLYTDFSTDYETVVKVDGVEAYRYSGREMVKSMCVSDSVIHTLTVPRDGSEVWTYRRDGVMVSSSNGNLLGGLYVDNGDVIFSYELNNTYYMSVNGSLSTISPPSGTQKVFAARRIDGTMNLIAADGSNNLVALEAGKQITVLGMYATYYEIDFGIGYDGDGRFYVGNLSDVALMKRENVTLANKNGSFVGFDLSGNSYFYVITYNSTQTIGCSGEESPWPDGMELMYDTCLGTDGYDYTIALINRDEGNAPTLWQNGAVTDCGFNGFFTHVDYW